MPCQFPCGLIADVIIGLLCTTPGAMRCAGGGQVTKMTDVLVMTETETIDWAVL
jgi:hypothetical protein